MLSTVLDRVTTSNIDHFKKSIKSRHKLHTKGIPRSSKIEKLSVVVHTFVSQTDTSPFEISGLIVNLMSRYTPWQHVWKQKSVLNIF